MSPAAMLMDERAARERVVAEALSWLGTRYHHGGRIKGHGVDCVHLLCAVYEAAGLAPPTDPGFYPRDWHLHQRTELYAQALDARLPRTATPQPGDVALFRYGYTYSHGAVLVSEREVVHAFMGRGVILSALTEEPLTNELGRTRPVLYWHMPIGG